MVDDQKARRAPAGDQSPTRERSTRQPAQIVRRGVEQLCALTGRTFDTVSGLESTDAGWRLQVDVVELERIPSSTDVLASYAVTLDQSGGLLAYDRVRRYVRNQAGDA